MKILVKLLSVCSCISLATASYILGPKHLKPTYSDSLGGRFKAANVRLAENTVSYVDVVSGRHEGWVLKKSRSIGLTPYLHSVSGRHETKLPATAKGTGFSNYLDALSDRNEASTPSENVKNDGPYFYRGAPLKVAPEEETSGIPQDLFVTRGRAESTTTTTMERPRDAFKQQPEVITTPSDSKPLRSDISKTANDVKSELMARSKSRSSRHDPRVTWNANANESELSDAAANSNTYGGMIVGNSPLDGPFAGKKLARRNEPAYRRRVSDLLDNPVVTAVQGLSLKTWAFPSAEVDRVQLEMRTVGRPLHSKVELWQGPDNVPQTMKIYVEDASKRPFKAVIMAPRGSNSVAVRNTGGMEFPLVACVEADTGPDLIGETISESKGRVVQGGAVHSIPFPSSVASVKILLESVGRPLNAKVELLQGPNNCKQSIEFYSEDGYVRPFFAIMETPGDGNVVRIVNTATMEFPLQARVEPYRIEEVP